MEPCGSASFARGSLPQAHRAKPTCRWLLVARTVGKRCSRSAPTSTYFGKWALQVLLNLVRSGSSEMWVQIRLQTQRRMRNRMLRSLTVSTSPPSQIKVPMRLNPSVCRHSAPRGPLVYRTLCLNRLVKIASEPSVPNEGVSSCCCVIAPCEARRVARINVCDATPGVFLGAESDNVLK